MRGKQINKRGRKNILFDFRIDDKTTKNINYYGYESLSKYFSNLIKLLGVNLGAYLSQVNRVRPLNKTLKV